MAISKEDVRHIAKLSRIFIPQEEEENFLKHFNGILNHVNKINNINTDNVQPCCNVFTLKNVMREDEPKQSYSPEELLKNAPSVEDTAYHVPKVVE